jgi:hypothetical protein
MAVRTAVTGQLIRMSRWFKSSQAHYTGFDQRVRVGSARSSVVTSGAQCSKNPFPATASMNPYGALRDPRGKQSPYLQHPLGSRGGVAGPVRLHEPLPPCRRFVGAGVGVDQAADAWR